MRQLKFHTNQISRLHIHTLRNLITRPANALVDVLADMTEDWSKSNELCRNPIECNKHLLPA